MSVVHDNQSQERLFHIILGPRISEKASTVAEKYKQFVFKVTPLANKRDIKQAVEKLFDVKVDQVRVCNVKGKTRTFKQVQGRRKNWKKAYVSLKEGFDIDFTGQK